MGGKYRRQGAIATLFLGIIVVGSIVPDLDHLVPGYRSWGHDIRIALGVFLLGRGIAYSGRQIKHRLLDKRKH